MKKINQLSVLLVCGFCVVTGDIMVYVQDTHRQIEVEFRDLSSTFGSTIPPQGIRAFVVYAEPANGCTPLKPPPNITNFTGHWAVLIKRYDCSFEKKVRAAQAANYDVAIVHNVNSSDLMRMQASNPEGILIPSIFIGSNTGQFIRNNYLYNSGYYIVIDDDESPFDIGTHLLLPFAIVVAICFSAMIGFMVVKCVKDHRRARRHRLPNSSLKKIPTSKFKKGDPYETCAICLDDFVEGEKLRLLPCSHAYHCKCIDPWLTRNKRVCPMCKRRVFAEDERVPTDSESGSEYDDDNTPLLRGSRNNNQGGGTFANDDLRARLLSRYLANLGRLQSASGTNTTYGGVGISPGAEGAEGPGPSQVTTAPDSSSADSISFHSDDSSSIFQPPPQPNVIVVNNFPDTTFSMDLSPPPPENPQRTALVFQQLPKKMRRRVMSHNAKRMPNRLKQAHSNLLDKCSAREVGKRPSRKYRRRPSNLRQEYTRRQKNNIWLETHIWHAKRFHMVNKWGYKLADFPNDKSYRACYRASAQHCLCQDISFLCCIELHGSVEGIITGLSKLSDDSFKRKSDLSGQREGSATFNCFTGEPIGQVNFLWSMGEQNSDIKQLWLWAHPAFCTQLLHQLQDVFKASSVTVNSLQHQLLRFRLIGPKTLDVLSGAFKPIDETSLSSWTADSDYYDSPLKINELHLQTEYLKKYLVTCDPGQLPPRSVLPALVTTHLPKLPEPLRQREIDPEVVLTDPVSNVCSPLWCEELRKAITAANERLKTTKKKEKINLVSSITPLPVDRTPISLLFIHRPGRQDSLRRGYGCGVDVICPSRWGMRIWLCLVHNGGRAAGLRDFDIVETDVTMKAKFIPDSIASNEHITSNYLNSREKHFKLPPAKRPNYQKLGISNPFEIPWNKLREEWDDSKELIRVYVISNGKMNAGSRIYLPSSSDFDNKNCPPVEPLHSDPNKTKRHEIKLKHKQTLRKLAKLRKTLRLKEVPKDELPSSKEIVDKHRVEMEELWLGECKNIRHNNIRETIGFVTEGNYSLLQGKCAGYGYITSGGLESLISLQGDEGHLVLTRTAVSLHYVFANLKVI